LRDQEKACNLFLGITDFQGAGHTQLETGLLYEIMNNYEDALISYIDSYQLYKKAEDRHGMAVASESQGRLAFRVGELAEAIKNLEESRSLYNLLGEHAKVRALMEELEEVYAAQEDIPN
jgi:tetratricopeptide (TPR) repeat protein